MEEPVNDSSKENIAFKERLKGFRFNSGGYQFNRDEANDDRSMKIRTIYNGKREDLSNHKFDRDEANNFD